ncbi:MAG TPA: hypothetical protein DCZ06_01650 [Alphaproteobacteria bacterium]|nr:hypothetical protein [Alphaproteobacteria bacterium]
MRSYITQYFSRVWTHIFPERQLYLRSRGEVRYVNLPPWLQCGVSLTLFAAIVWSVISTVSFVLEDRIRAARDHEIAEVRKAYTHLTTEVAQIQQRFLTTTLELESKQRTLEQLAQQEQAERNPGSTTDKFAAMAPNPGELDGTRQLLSWDPPDSGVDSPAAALSVFGIKVAALENRLSLLDGAQSELITVFAQETETAIGELETLIGQTGLDVEQLVTTLQSDTAPIGGPLILLEPQNDAHATEALNLLTERVGRLTILRNALFRLPLVEPTENYYISSRYGYRQDPLAKHRAFHSGIDLVAPLGTPVFASAAGTVISAGRNGPYGNMVEIDHGYGIRSRYGHLHRVEVEEGQQVDSRDRIGRVGNTGRSTGPHLHFEVWFNDRTHNPRNFLKAGKRVF